MAEALWASIYELRCKENQFHIDFTRFSIKQNNNIFDEKILD